MINDSSSIFTGILEELFGTGGQDIIGGEDIGVGTSVFGLLFLVILIGAVV